MHYVYILIKNDIPAYVGVATNVKRRVREHRYHKPHKDFDSYIIFYESEDKKECLSVERTLINFSSIYQNNKAILPLNAKSEGHNIICSILKEI